MMSYNNNLNKKRKTNDGQATTDGVSTNDGSSFQSSGRRDETSSGLPQDDNKISQLDRMEQVMMRMEEKLTTVSSLESRCENLEAKCSKLEDLLEAKCSSLETKLATTSHATQDHMDRSLRYHEMRILNQKWKYSAPVYSRYELMDADYNVREAEYIIETSKKLKQSTEAMRRGDFPTENNRENKKGISLYTSDQYYSFDEDTTDKLSPHWREFAAALKQFKPVFDMLPDDCETSIELWNFALNREMTELIQDALVNMPFKMLTLQNSYQIHGGMSTIANIMKNNKYLQKLDMFEFQDMDGNDIAELCSAIHRHPSLVEVSMEDCFSDELGNEMLRTLLRTDELKLERLDMPSNNISSVEITLLPDFLASNPKLIELNLTENKLDASDAVLIANALRSNTTLRCLHLDISWFCERRKVGEEALRVAVRDDRSLNAVANSNHSCEIVYDYLVGINESDSRDINRTRKIYTLLSSRNETMSNVQDFVDIDVKLLPNILEAVQKYSRLTEETEDYVEALSIVYEVMRRWDKVSSLYKSFGCL